MRYAVYRKLISIFTDFLLYDEAKELRYKFTSNYFLPTIRHYLMNGDGKELLAMQKRGGQWRLIYDIFQNEQLIAQLSEHGWLRPYFSTFQLSTNDGVLFTITVGFRGGYRFKQNEKSIAKFRTPFFPFTLMYGHLDINLTQYEEYIIGVFGILEQVGEDRDRLLQAPRSRRFSSPTTCS